MAEQSFGRTFLILCGHYLDFYYHVLTTHQKKEKTEDLSVSFPLLFHHISRLRDNFSFEEQHAGGVPANVACRREELVSSLLDSSGEWVKVV